MLVAAVATALVLSGTTLLVRTGVERPTRPAADHIKSPGSGTFRFEHGVRSMMFVALSSPRYDPAWSSSITPDASADPWRSHSVTDH